MRVLLAAVSSFLAGLVGVGSPAASPPPGAVTCESIVHPGGTVVWRPKRVVLGVVAVPPTYLPQTVPTGQGRWPYWSKAGLVVRADSPPILISVSSRWRSRVAIAWGSAGPAGALRIASCPPSSSLGDWNPYAGGFVLRSRSACVPLAFRVGERTTIVRFGVGKRCG